MIAYGAVTAKLHAQSSDVPCYSRPVVSSLHTVEDPEKGDATLN